jgi:hypothetical protein
MSVSSFPANLPPAARILPDQSEAVEVEINPTFGRWPGG